LFLQTLEWELPSPIAVAPRQSLRAAGGTQLVLYRLDVADSPRKEAKKTYG
jgi:hypothetical protein